MSRHKEILRYLYTTSFSRRKIAESLHVGRDTIADVMNRATELNLKWEEVKGKDEIEIKELLFPQTKKETIMTMPNFDALIKELDHPGVTRKLLSE